MVTSVEHWKKKKISIFSTMSSPWARMCVCIHLRACSNKEFACFSSIVILFLSRCSTSFSRCLIEESLTSRYFSSYIFSFFLSRRRREKKTKEEKSFFLLRSNTETHFKHELAISLLSSSLFESFSMRWCVVIISKRSKEMIEDKWELFLPLSNRYARCLIRYHLFIIICALIMTSICCLLIYKYDQWHFQAHLRVNSIKGELRWVSLRFSFLGISSTWNEIFRWLSKIHCSYSRNSYCTFISSFIVFECKSKSF